MLFGEFERSLDEKGRMVLPPVFRREFADVGYLSSSMNRPCLLVVNQEEMHAMAKRLKKDVRKGKLSPDELRIWSASISTVNVDSQGRIAVPQKLRDTVGIERSAALIGAIDRAEIWEPAAWALVQSNSDDRLSEGYWQ